MLAGVGANTWKDELPSAPKRLDEDHGGSGRGIHRLHSHGPYRKARQCAECDQHAGTRLRHINRLPLAASVGMIRQEYKEKFLQELTTAEKVFFLKTARPEDVSGTHSNPQKF